MEAQRHSFEEHTGEVRLQIVAQSEEALFAEAGRALAELMLGEVPPVPHDAPAEGLEVHAPDRAALLVDWLNELIFQSEISKRVFTSFEMGLVDETTAIGLVRGVRPRALKTAVKAATLHGATVEQQGDLWQASVVVDV